MYIYIYIYTPYVCIYIYICVCMRGYHTMVVEGRHWEIMYRQVVPNISQAAVSEATRCTGLGQRGEVSNLVFRV